MFLKSNIFTWGWSCCWRLAHSRLAQTDIFIVGCSNPTVHFAFVCGEIDKCDGLWGYMLQPLSTLYSIYHVILEQKMSVWTINIHAPTPLYIVSISFKYFPRVTWSNIFPVALLIPPSLQLLICLCWDWYDLSRLLSCSHLSHFEGITLILYLPLITFPCFAHQ